MNGVTIQAQQPLEFANSADIVLFGSGIYTRAIADSFGKKGSLLDRLQLDPVRQTIGGQCSGVLLMARLGLLADQPAATDLTTRPWLMEAGVRVDDSPFRARGPIATAGGCLASQYLSAWAMVRGAGWAAAGRALHYAAPVGEKDELRQARARHDPAVRRRRRRLSARDRLQPSSSMFFGQLSLSSRDSARSASSLPPVWQRAQ